MSRAAVLIGLAALCSTLATAGTDAVEEPTAQAAHEPVELRFRDFFKAPHGPRGLEMTPALLAADGRRVRLTGYMVTQERPTRGYFFLAPLPLTMSVHSDGDADDLPPATVLVVMPAPDRELPVLRTRGLMQLTGQLQVGRHEMAGGRVVWVRLLLDPRPHGEADPSS
jgi:hypothetical protein